MSGNERSLPTATHEVLNQPPPLIDYDVFSSDRVLTEALEREGGGWAREQAAQVGTMAGADAMRERIEAHPWPRGGVEVVRANRGYTLYSRRTGGQVARRRPTGKSDDVQVLWWRREAWASPGDFGPIIMPLNEALDFVATESFFWIGA